MHNQTEPTACPSGSVSTTERRLPPRERLVCFLLAVVFCHCFPNAFSRLGGKG